MQEQYSSQKQSIIQELVLGKKWEEAEQMLAHSPKSKEFMIQLVDLYGKLSLEDEEQYQRFLKLIIQQIDINLQYSIYSETITAIVTQLINTSSPKYALVIIRGLLAQLQSNSIGRFIVLSNLYLFAALFYDSTFGDLVCFYGQFVQSRKQISSQIDISQNQANLDVNKIVVASLSQLLRNINAEHKIISQAKHKEAIVFYSKIVNNIQNVAANTQKYQQVYYSSMGVKYEQTLLLFLQKHNVDISKEQLALAFMKAITKWNINTSLLSYEPFVLSNRAFTKLLLVMVCGQLSNDLNAMPEILNEDCVFLAQAILKICNFLSQQAQLQNYQFLSTNTHKIEQFVQKANIFMGAINLKDEIYKQLTQTFLTLNFLPKQFKQRVLSKLIQKHRNQSFKGHLISQYRKLLTFKTPKHIWIRSTPILFRELGQLQPKSSVDYIGHILSFAYYWKEVGNKLVQQKQSIHIDVSHNRVFFGEKLSALRKGLEDRLKVLSTEDKEQQRNQISVCLFRIEQLLTANDR